MSSDGTQGPVLVHGIKPEDPANPPVRLEVRDVIKDHPDQWNLYLLGLERFQNSVDEKLPLSYFEIAGIHGLPYKKWPDRDWNNKMVRVDNRFGGFCTHSSILFLTWHRPYLALFEAELYKHVNAVADEFEESERKADYVKAAKNFRMPYWDWARPDLGVFPTQATAQARVHVKRPHGKQQDFLLDPNPLATYRFRESKSDRNINRFPAVGGTIRYPGQTTSNSLVQQLTRFFAGTDQSPRGKNLTERVLFILQSYQDFGAASHNRFNPPEKPGQPDFAEWGSIEDIHNAIHTYSGGGGHMGDPTVAAFDPIFWLHHTNIDRLFAIWQACHDDPKDPSTYVTDRTAGTGSIGGNFFVKAGGAETVKTPLAPFAQSGNKDNQTFWTSEGVRYTTEFGYVYPETQKSKFPTKKDILNELDRLYGKNASLANILRNGEGDFLAVSEEFRSRARAHLQAEEPSLKAAAAAPAADPAEQKPLSQSPANGSADVELPEDRDLKKLVGPGNKYLEWLVNIKAEKAELGGNYVVHVFLGSPDDAIPLLYVTNHSHVGAFATFGQDEHTACKNCQEGRASGQRITGQVPLTIALAERYVAGLLESLTPDHVIPYLQKNLHWRVTLADGELQQRSQLQNLLVSVVTVEVKVPGSPTDLPQYADEVTPQPLATTNRNGTGRGDGTGYDGSNF
ncbi:Tyrosinase [Colletotrichum shisoi]|uniref:tyrosinase n=1 Tax=Colletotrichum shisoi TaxID=2078593 RepID=A0A5Q4BX03_9PEZI|nr:Tyrosinase [Colletotrichum shisoi]